MTDYDETFARKVLAFVASRHPNRVQMMEIKEAITPEPTDGELLVALDALAIDGYIEGKALRESSSGKSKLAVMANVLSTKSGRELLKPVTKTNEGGGISNLHFHGPVGAVGHQSTGSVTVNQQWIAAAPEPDWHVVAQAFKEAAANKAKVASSSGVWPSPRWQKLGERQLKRTKEVFSKQFLSSANRPYPYSQAPGRTALSATWSTTSIGN